MTAAVATPPAAADSRKPLFFSVLKSEVIKLRTLRSTYWCLLAIPLLMLAFALLATPPFAGAWDKGEHMLEKQVTFLQGTGTTAWVLQGGGLANLAVGVLGILFITGEYSSGMIKTTFAAVPQRRLVMLAKAVTVAIPVLIVSLVFALVSFEVGMPFFRGKTFHGVDISYQLGDPGTWRMIIGGALYLAVSAIIGIGIGTFIRHTGGSITLFAGIFFVLPGLMQLVPEDIRNNIMKFLPSTAGGSLFQPVHFPGVPVLDGPSPSLAPWVGFAVYCAWAVLFYFLAVLRVSQRDA